MDINPMDASGEALRPALHGVVALPNTCCTSCPSAMWHRSSSEIRCFCRVAHSLTWGPDTEHQLQLVECDGRLESIVMEDAP